MSTATAHIEAAKAECTARGLTPGVSWAIDGRWFLASVETHGPATFNHPKGEWFGSFEEGAES
jgi:hypothetical protein